MISPSNTLDVSVDVVYATGCPYLDQASFNNTNQLHTCKEANIWMNKQSLEGSVRHLGKQTATWKKQPLSWCRMESSHVKQVDICVHN